MVKDIETLQMKYSFEGVKLHEFKGTQEINGFRLIEP